MGNRGFSAAISYMQVAYLVQSMCMLHLDSYYAYLILCIILYLIVYGLMVVIAILSYADQQVPLALSEERLVRTRHGDDRCWFGSRRIPYDLLVKGGYSHHEHAGKYC